MAKEKVSYEFDADVKGYTGKVKTAKSQTDDFDDSVKTSSKDITNLGNRSQETGEKMVSVGTKAAAAGAVIVGAMALGVKAVLDFEAGLQVFDKVFEGGSEKVMKFYTDNKKFIALTEDEYKGLAGQIGDTLKPFGIMGDELDTMTAETLNLATALSQWKGVKLEDSIKAVNGALLGEREQLKGLGVVIKEADVDAKALEMTHKTSASQLTELEKAQATLALAYERGNDAVENFGVLTTLQKLEVAWSRVKEAILGAIDRVLIPYVDKAAEVIIKLAEKLDDPKFAKFLDTMVIVGTVLGTVLLVGGTVLVVVGKLISLFGTFQTVIAALGAVSGPVLIAIGAAILLAATYFDEFKEAFEKVFDSEKLGKMKESFDAIVESVKGIIDAIKSGDFSEIGDLFGDIATNLGTLLIEAVQGLIDFIGQVDWLTILNDLATNVGTVLNSVITGLIDLLKKTDWKGMLVDLASNLGNLLIDTISALVTFLGTIDWGGIIADLINITTDFFASLPKMIADFLVSVDWGQLFMTILEFLWIALKNIWNLLKGIDWFQIIEALLKWFYFIPVLLFELLKKIPWSDIGSWLWDAIVKAVSALDSFIWNLVKDVGSWMWSSITSALGGFGSWIWSLIKDIGSWIWNSITSALSGLGDWIGNKVAGVGKTLTNMLPFGKALAHFERASLMAPIGGNVSSTSSTSNVYNYNFNGSDSSSSYNLMRIKNRLVPINGG